MTVHGLLSMVISMTVTVTYFLYHNCWAALDIHSCEPTNPPTESFMSAEPLEQCYVKEVCEAAASIANTAYFFT